MTLREVTIPEPTTLDRNGRKWGLIEWLLESMGDLANTAEGHDVITQVYPIVYPLKGEEQGGKTFTVTQGQLEKLQECSRITNKGMVAMENLLAVSGYLQALRMAKYVDEKKPVETKPEEPPPAAQ